MLNHLSGSIRCSCFVLVSVFVVAGGSLSAEETTAEDKKAEEKKAEKKITYDEHVLPIFRKRCGSCHNGNDQKGGLTLDNYLAMTQGGGSGDVIEPGDAESSYLYMLITHDSEPVMPPGQPKMPESELSLIAKWINQGAPENAGSKVRIKKKSNNLARVEVTMDRPSDAPVMPETIPLDPVVVTSRPNTITALACSPWAPLAAVSGHHQILLYDTKYRELVGVLPYPEGIPHSLNFTRNGRMLVAGGGRGGASGNVVIFDVKTGARIAEIGGEYDSVLASDMSSDQTLVALGGPKKMVRVFDAATGEQKFEMAKHTDWITAAEFSPDGVLLATGDRSNGLLIWEAFTGREFHFLKDHKGTISSISWRADSNVLAAGDEEGKILLWEMNNGTSFKNWTAHGGGVTAIQFARDGRIVSTGRDRKVKLWAADGKGLGDLATLPEMGLEIAFDNELDQVIAGDWSGQVHVIDVKTKKVVGQLAANPKEFTVRFSDLTSRIAKLDDQIDSLNGQEKALMDRVSQRAQQAKAAADKLAEMQKDLTAAQQAAKQQQEALKQMEAKAAESKAAYEATQQVNAAKAEELKLAQAQASTAKAELDRLRKELTAKQQAAKNDPQAASSAKVLEQILAAVKPIADQQQKAEQNAQAATTKAAADLKQAQTAFEAQQKAVAAKKSEVDAANKLVETKTAAVTTQTAEKDKLAKAAPMTGDEKKQLDGWKEQRDTLQAELTPLQERKVRMEQRQQQVASAKK